MPIVNMIYPQDLAYAQPKQVDALMDPHMAAAYLNVSPLTLADWRSQGEAMGPTYVKVGRSVRYRLSDLEAWLQSRTRQGA